MATCVDFFGLLYLFLVVIWEGLHAFLGGLFFSPEKKYVVDITTTLADDEYGFAVSSDETEGPYSIDEVEELVKKLQRFFEDLYGENPNYEVISLLKPYGIRGFAVLRKPFHEEMESFPRECPNSPCLFKSSLGRSLLPMTSFFAKSKGHSSTYTIHFDAGASGW
jgi:hypothetical protein